MCSLYTGVLLCNFIYKGFSFFLLKYIVYRCSGDDFILDSIKHCVCVCVSLSLCVCVCALMCVCDSGRSMSSGLVSSIICPCLSMTAAVKEM